MLYTEELKFSLFVWTNHLCNSGQFQRRLNYALHPLQISMEDVREVNLLQLDFILNSFKSLERIKYSTFWKTMIPVDHCLLSRVNTYVVTAFPRVYSHPVTM